MQRICLFPGTFDPVTLGHTDIIDRAMNLFDRIVIGIGTNSTKKPMFSKGQRLLWCQSIYKGNPKVKVLSYSGLTVNFCKEIKANYILRGIRYTSDFEYEKAIADMNRRLYPDIETIFLTASPEYSTLASTLVREVLSYGGDASPFLPLPVIKGLKLK